MPQQKTLGLVGASVLAAAIAGTVIVNRTRPTEPPLPAGCDAIDVQKATEYSRVPGYAYLFGHCEITHAYFASGTTDNVIDWLPKNGYPSPLSKQCTAHLTIDLRIQPDPVAARASDTLFMPYHGEVYAAKYDPKIDVQDLYIDNMPCWLDKPNLNEITLGHRTIVQKCVDTTTGKTTDGPC